jgi:hypothetical protein
MTFHLRQTEQIVCWHVEVEMSVATDDRSASNGSTRDGAEGSERGVASQEEPDGFNAALAEVVQNRAIIEQAKGMLMFVYGIDALGAFEKLRWLSQQNNVKLRLLAERVVQDLTTASRQRPPVNPETYDALILTAHARVTAPR